MTAAVQLRRVIDNEKAWRYSNSAARRLPGDHVDRALAASANLCSELTYGVRSIAARSSP